MKNKGLLFLCVIALVAAAGFVLAGCEKTTDGGGGGLSADLIGVWKITDNSIDYTLTIEATQAKLVGGSASGNWSEMIEDNSTNGLDSIKYLGGFIKVDSTTHKKVVQVEDFGLGPTGRIPDGGGASWAKQP